MGSAASPKAKPAGRRRARELWRKGARMAREQLFDRDPLAKEKLEERPSEVVLRHRWIRGEWQTDVATLKVADEPFAEGSMRQCWYAKKLSSRVTVRHQKSGSKHAQWPYQRNYVLKRYKPTSAGLLATAGKENLSVTLTQKKLLSDDVQTQAESKELARKYNGELTTLLKNGQFDRRSPKPMKYKCVDMLEPCLVYFPDRDAYFFMEAFVEGDFRKYNDNAGYVRGVVDSDWRATPQAYSHFTFAHSVSSRIVVDVQGVGDLFTDPQIHTSDSVGYGLGNGGLRGMSLFFLTHRCNRICRCMNLPPVHTLGGGCEESRLSSSSRDDEHEDDDSSSSSSSSYERRDAEERELLKRLETALDDYGLLPQHDDGDTPQALGASLSAGVARALQHVVATNTSSPRPRRPSARRPWHAAGSSCALARHVHKTLGFMFLRGNDPILKTASPANAVFHLAAAALGGDPTAAHFLTAALADRSRRRTDGNDGDLPERRLKRTRLADAATRAAAFALLLVAVRNISSLLTPR